MATYNIPNEGLIRQLNRGDIAGELWASKNIDLATSPGKIKLARPVEKVMTAGDLGNDRLEAIVLFEDNIFPITASNIYKDSDPYNNYSLGTSGPTAAQDAVVFDGVIRIAEDTDIARYNGSASFSSTWWTSDISGTALTTGVPHVLHVLRASGKDTIAVTDGSTLRYYNSEAGHTSFSWDSNLIACSQASGLNYGWIGTYNETGEEAELIQWQVGNDAYTQAYPIGAKAALSVVVKDNIPIIVTERGEIKRFNQAGFTTIATLPMWNTPEFLDGVRTGLIQSSNTARPIHPKGMQIFGDKLLVYVNMDSVDKSTNVNARALSGVYEVDLITGSVTHRMSPDNESVLSLSGPVMVINDQNGRVYFGGRKSALLSSEEGLWREDLTADVTNYGYFVTTEMHSASFKDNYEKIILSACQDTGHSIVVKYREKRSFSRPITADGTWLDTTKFTTTDTVTGIAAGDEVEILVGSNGGRLTHITNIETSASTTTIEVEDAIGTAAESVKVQMDNWTKINDPHDTTNVMKEIGLNQPGGMYQFKVYLTGANGYPEINRMTVKTNNKEPQ